MEKTYKKKFKNDFKKRRKRDEEEEGKTTNKKTAGTIEYYRKMYARKKQR